MRKNCVIWAGIVAVLCMSVSVLSGFPLTVNTRDDTEPQISGGNVVWTYNDGNDTEIMFYDGVKTLFLTNNSVNDEQPQISGKNVVWEAYWTGNPSINMFDGEEVWLICSGSLGGNRFPRIFGKKIVWEHNDGHDKEIWYYSWIGFNGSSIIPLTNNSDDDVAPRISSKGIVWRSRDETDYEIHISPTPKTIK